MMLRRTSLAGSFAAALGSLLIVSCGLLFSGTESGNPSLDGPGAPTLDEPGMQQPNMSSPLPSSTDRSGAGSTGVPGSILVPGSVVSTETPPPVTSSSSHPSASAVVTGGTGTATDGSSGASSSAPVTAPTWPDTPSTPSSGATGAGSSPSPSTGNCLPVECQSSAQAAAQALAVPAAAELPFDGAECQLMNDVGTCVCSRELAPAVALNAANACVVAGRLGCLMTAEEAPECLVGSDAGGSTCEAACNDVAQRVTQDRERTWSASVLSSECRTTGCSFVLLVEGEGCFEGAPLTPVPCP